MLAFKTGDKVRRTALYLDDEVYTVTRDVHVSNTSVPVVTDDGVDILFRSHTVTLA